MNIVHSLIKMLTDVGGDGMLAAANYQQKIQLRQEAGEGQHTGSDLFLTAFASTLWPPSLALTVPPPQIGEISAANLPILNDFGLTRQGGPRSNASLPPEWASPHSRPIVLAEGRDRRTGRAMPANATNNEQYRINMQNQRQPQPLSNDFLFSLIFILLWFFAALPSRLPPDLEQALPTSTVEEERQLQLAIALSQQDSKKVPLKGTHTSRFAATASIPLWKIQKVSDLQCIMS